MLTKLTSRILILLLSFFVGVTLSRVMVSKSASKAQSSLEYPLSRSLRIESVPEMSLPDSVTQFNAPDFRIDMSAKFDKDGTVKDVYPQDNFFYTVSVPSGDGYATFPVETNRKHAVEVQRDLVMLLRNELQRIKFQPRIVGGQPVAEDVWLTAHFRIGDAFAPQIPSLNYCNCIELTFRAGNKEIWQRKLGAEGYCSFD